MMKLNLAYLTPNSAKGYAFYLIPKELIDNPVFDVLDYGSKLLYGLMLNRASLSAVNAADFTDENGNLYIIYTIEQVMADMRCARQTAVKMIKLLDEIGLIEKKRRGQGKPSIIYVKDFSTEFSTEFSTGQSLNSKKSNLRSVKNTSQEVEKVQCSNLNQKNQNHSYNNPIISAKTQIGNSDSIDSIDIDTLTDELKEEYPAQAEEIDELCDLIKEVLTSRKKSFRIAKEDMPADKVKTAFRRLNSAHIIYILGNLKKNTSKVKNIKSYLLTALFNAARTYNSHSNLDVQNWAFENFRIEPKNDLKPPTRS